MVTTYRSYRKDHIADKMLETALDLHFEGGDGFSIIHLAAAAEEVLSGFIKSSRDENNSASVKTAWEKTICNLKEIHSIHGSERTDKQIKDYLNFVRNKTKHPKGKNDPVAISACLELEVRGAILRAIENYILHFGQPTDKMVRYINLISQSLCTTLRSRGTL